MKEDYLEDLLTIPFIYSPQISPDGKYLAYSWRNINPNIDVFCVPTDGSSKPVALSNTPEMTIVRHFYPKSDAILVGEDKSRNERVRLFRINLDNPLEMIPLTMDTPPFFLRGGRIDPSEKWLIYGANYSLSEKKEIEPTYIYKHNLDTDEMVCLAKPDKPTWLFPDLSKDGHNILYSRKEYHPKGEQKWVVDIDGDQDREILNFGEKARVFASWLPDSKRIAFITDTKENIEQKHYSLGIFNIESEEIIWVIDDPSRSIEDFSVPRIGNYFLVSEYEKSKEKVSIINMETLQETKLPRIAGNYYPIAPLNSKEWIGKYYSSTQPDDIIKFNIDNIDPMNFKSLTDVWKQTRLQNDDLTAAEDFDWKSHDGVNVHGWLYKPTKPNGKTIIYVHGGPTAHSEDAINSEIQYFTKLGFTVLDPNYRGSTGYGYTFEDSIRDKGWGADEQEDILSGIKTMISRGIAVSGKVGITGTSYGGYSAWFGITKAPFDMVAASAPICGMTDLVIDYETTRPDLRPLSAEMMGGTPTEVPEIYFERSPINFVQNIQGKLLIIQGGRDPNVSPKNVEEVRKKLDEHKIAYEEYIFEDEGHGIVKAKNQKTLFKMLADFFEKSL